MHNFAFGLFFISLVCFGEDSIYGKGEISKKDSISLYGKNNSTEPSATYFTEEIKEEKSLYDSNAGKRLANLSGQELSFFLKNVDQVSYTNSKDMINKLSTLSNYHAGLSLFTISEVESPIFKKIFEESKGAGQVGSLVFSLDQKLLGGDFSLNYLTGLGVSYFKGRGYFVDDGSESDTRLTLWLVPVDMGLAGSIKVKSYARVLIGAGYSGVVAVQSRSDSDEDEVDIFQFGHGPFLTTKLNIGLNQLFPKFSLGMFRDYGVTNTYLNLEYRFHSYSNFTSDFSVSGNSLGVGLSFDFI